MRKAKREFKGMYVVQNYGAFRGLFYFYTSAERFVRKEGTDKKTGKEYYQIYKCDVGLKNMVPRNKSAKELKN